MRYRATGAQDDSANWFDGSRYGENWGKKRQVCRYDDGLENSCLGENRSEAC